VSFRREKVYRKATTFPDVASQPLRSAARVRPTGGEHHGSLPTPCAASVPGRGADHIILVSTQEQEAGRRTTARHGLSLGSVWFPAKTAADALALPCARRGSFTGVKGI
jgi:hypothetical protein